MTPDFRHNLIRRFASQARVRPARLDVRLGQADADDAAQWPPGFVVVEMETSTQPASSPVAPADLSPFFLVATPSSRRRDNRTVLTEYVFGVRQPLAEQSLEGVLRFPSGQAPLFQLPYRVSRGLAQADCRLRLSVTCATAVEDKFAEVSAMFGLWSALARSWRLCDRMHGLFCTRSVI